MPIQAIVVFPLDELSKLAAHKEQLLAWVRHPIAKEGAQICKLLPVISRHLADERALAVNDLIVGKRQDEVLTKGIHKGEGQFVLIPLAVNRVE